jgi:hypothetical protein
VSNKSQFHALMNFRFFRSKSGCCGDLLMTFVLNRDYVNDFDCGEDSAGVLGVGGAVLWHCTAWI